MLAGAKKVLGLPRTRLIRQQTQSPMHQLKTEVLCRWGAAMSGGVQVVHLDATA